jgi:hypothetical protein
MIHSRRLLVALLGAATLILPHSTAHASPPTETKTVSAPYTDPEPSESAAARRTTASSAQVTAALAPAQALQTGAPAADRIDAISAKQATRPNPSTAGTDGSVSSAGTHMPGKHKKTYVGGAGEEGPQGRDCRLGAPELGQPDISQGGACFNLAPGATSVTVTVTDRVSAHIMGEILFVRDSKPLYYTYFCDTIHFDSAPRDANAIHVSILEVVEVLENVPEFAQKLPCTNATPGTTGTVTATF